MPALITINATMETKKSLAIVPSDEVFLPLPVGARRAQTGARQGSVAMKILLVSPEFPDTFWSFRHALKFVRKEADSPPLGLLTVAAMLPEEWEKRLVDMNAKTRPEIRPQRLATHIPTLHPAYREGARQAHRQDAR